RKQPGGGNVNPVLPAVEGAVDPAGVNGVGDLPVVGVQDDVLDVPGPERGGHLGKALSVAAADKDLGAPGRVNDARVRCAVGILAPVGQGGHHIKASNFLNPGKGSALVR